MVTIKYGDSKSNRLMYSSNNIIYDINGYEIKAGTKTRTFLNPNNPFDYED
jgi:hypothetical protein